MDRATESNHWSFSIQLRKNMLGKLLKLLFEGGAEDWRIESRMKEEMEQIDD